MHRSPLPNPTLLQSLVAVAFQHEAVRPLPHGPMQLSPRVESHNNQSEHAAHGGDLLHDGRASRALPMPIELQRHQLDHWTLWKNEMPPSHQ